MAYLTRDEIESQFEPGTFDGITDELWDSVLSGVDGLMAAYIGVVDLTTLIKADKDMLKQTALWLARYKLQDNLPYDEVMDDAWHTRYLMALERLKMIADGTLKISSLPVTQAVNMPVLTSEARRGWGEYG
jgi:hypothetical protein